MARGFTGPPCGGMAGVLNYVSSSVSIAVPTRGYRVIAASVYAEYIAYHWYEHHAKAMIGKHHPLPFLAKRSGPGVYFTDRESLEGILQPAEFAQRVALSARDHVLCQRYGCIIVIFTVPNTSLVQIPPPTAGASPGLTPRRAREWICPTAIEADETMDIIHVYPAPTGTFFYYLPLE